MVSRLSVQSFLSLCFISVMFNHVCQSELLGRLLAGLLIVSATNIILNGEEFVAFKIKAQSPSLNKLSPRKEFDDDFGLRPQKTNRQPESEIKITEAKLPAAEKRHIQEYKLKNLQTLYEGDKPFEAVKELDTLRTTGSISEAALFSDDSKALISKVDEAQKEIFRLIDCLEADENWRFRMRHKQSEIFASKADPRDFKVFCVCPDSDILDLISLIIETQFYSRWLPGCVQSTRYDHSMFFQNLYLRLKLPFPLKDRDVLLKGYGDVWKGDKVMIYVGDVDQAKAKEAESRLKVRSGAVRAAVIFSGILLQPLEKGTKLTVISRLDAKLDFLPDAIFDYAAKFVLAELCCFLRDRSKSMKADPENFAHQPWIERQKGSESHVYKEIRERLSKMVT